MTVKPRFTFKKYAEYLLIIWVFLIAIDTGQTAYALTFYPLQFTETNPLGFPLGTVFIFCIWMSLCGLTEFKPRISPYIITAVIILSINTVFAVVHNFITLIR
jgi:hypothetical protein